MKRTFFFIYSEKGQTLDVDSMANKSGSLSPRSEESKFTCFPAIPKRFIILILLALGNFNMYCIRMCLNVTIVAMTHGEGKKHNSTGLHLSEDMVSFIICFQNPKKNILNVT